MVTDGQDLRGVKPVPRPAGEPEDLRGELGHVPSSPPANPVVSTGVDNPGSSSSPAGQGAGSVTSISPSGLFPSGVIQPVDVSAMLAAPGFLGSKDEIEAELDLIARAMRTFHVKHMDQVMRECAAYSARLTELATLLYRVESLDRQYIRVRTQQVQRFIDELGFQFKIASRLLEQSRQDIELSK